MTKLERLEKEYHDTMVDLFIEDGSPEMHKALQDKCNRLADQIQEEKIRIAKRRKANEQKNNGRGNTSRIRKDTSRKIKC